MPAQSPTLSPTLSAMVAALRGSSSGIPASTFPTRSAPTSAALVKMPPPTRMNSASSEAPKAKPISTAVAEFWKIMTMAVAPSRPRPTQSMPVTAPVRKATFSAPAILPPLAAAAAVRTLPRTAMRHADEPGEAGEGGPEQEADHPVDPGLGEAQGHRPVRPGHLGGREEDQDGQRHDDDEDHLELALQEGLRALLDGLGDLPHLGGAGDRPPGRRASRTRPATMPITPAAMARTSQTQSVLLRWKAWYPPSATRAWFMPGGPFLCPCAHRAAVGGSTGFEADGDDSDWPAPRQGTLAGTTRRRARHGQSASSVGSRSGPATSS